MSSSKVKPSSPTLPSTSLPVCWDYVQQTLELCAGISELDPNDATQAALKQLGIEGSSNIQKSVDMYRTFGMGRRSPRTMLTVTNSPTDRFRVRKRAAVASEKPKVLKKAVSEAEREIEAFTKNHGTGRPAIIPLEEAEQLVKKAEQTGDVKEMMAKVNNRQVVEQHEAADRNGVAGESSARIDDVLPRRGGAEDGMTLVQTHFRGSYYEVRILQRAVSWQVSGKIH